MNRGNLAEDPKAGLSSSSRYSRNGGEKNSLLYVDSSSVRKERRAAERRAGNQASAIKGNHNSKRKMSVGRGLTDSHMDRLEVGSDGRLFHVKENPESSVSNSNSSDLNTSYHTEKRAKPERSCLTQANPLLKKRKPEKRVVSEREKSETQESVIVEGEAPDKAAPEAKEPVIKETETSAAQGQKTASDMNRRERNSENPLLKNAKAEKKTSRRKGQKSAAEGIAPIVEEDPNSAVETKAVDTKTVDIKAVDTKAAVVQETEISVSANGPSARGFLYRFRIPLIASAVALASAGYAYAAWHYSDRFYPGTEFFGIPAAEQSVYDVKAAIKEKVDSYSLQLDARKPQADASGSQESSFASGNVIDAEDVGMVYRDNGEIDNAMKQQKSWAWPVMMLACLFGDEDSFLETSYDDSLIPEAVSNLSCMQKANMIKPQDAQIILTDDGAQVQTEIYGTTLDVAKTEDAVREALNDGCTSIDLDDLGLYVNPKVNSSDLSLSAKAMAMNKVLGAKILLRFGNHTEVINSEVIAKFLSKEGSSYVLNEDKVRKYVTRLAKKYDTYQKSRDFYTSIGTKITLEDGIGDYGWEMDQEETYNKILDAIYSQKKTTIDPVYTREAYCRDTNDIGSTYVEISLTNQMMWFYKNGDLVVKTPVVTGNPYAGHETPSGGVWYLKGRARNQLLSGQGYSSPVDYWMPFNNGVGIHDMQSRAWFGGSIYLGSGSHGCVNTPLAAVKLIFDQIEEGVPIIVYKDESEKALSLCTDPIDAQTLTAEIENTYGTVEDDGGGSIVAWSRTKAAQEAIAQQQAAAQAAAQASGTPVI